MSIQHHKAKVAPMPSSLHGSSAYLVTRDIPSSFPPPLSPAYGVIIRLFLFSYISGLFGWYMLYQLFTSTSNNIISYDDVNWICDDPIYYTGNNIST